MKRFKFLEEPTEERITDYQVYEMDVDHLSELRDRIRRISSSLNLHRPMVDLSFMELYPHIHRTHDIDPTPTVTPTITQ